MFFVFNIKLICFNQCIFISKFSLPISEQGFKSYGDRWCYNLNVVSCRQVYESSSLKLAC